MRNLLWKFVALVGVAGIGFMVVLQVMEGLSDVPDLSSSQAAAASDEPGRTEQPSPEPDPIPSLPPLETKETVALANPFPPMAEQNPADAVQPYEDSRVPVPVGDPTFPTPEIGEPTPLETPSQFPPTPTPAEFPAPELGRTELPILVPTTEESAAPSLEAFSDGPSTPESPGFPEVPGPTPATAPEPLPKPSLGENNPFTDPTPTPSNGEPQTQETAFDPYEPLPESTPSLAPTPAPESPIEPVSSQIPAEPTTSESSFNLAFPPPEPMPEPASPSFPPGDAPETAATEGQPLIAPVPETPEKSDPLDNPPPLPAPNKTPAPTTQADPPRQETSPDPFTPKKSPSSVPPLPAPSTNEAPGRAKVRTPSANQPNQPPLAPPAFPEPPPPTTLPRPEPPSVPKPPPASLTPMPPVERPSREVKPLPNITMPLVEERETPVSSKGPNCAVPKDPNCAIPVVAVGEAPPARTSPERASFVDPLDQLTFPDSPPSRSKVPEHTKPEHHLVPAANNVPSVSEISREPRQDPRSLPEISPSPLNANPKAPLTSIPQTVSNASASQENPTAPRTLESLPLSGPQQPKLKIEKTAPPKAVLNQPMIYHILVRNIGASAAHQVVVEDQVPEGTTLTGTIPRGEMANNRLVWRLGVLNPGEEKKIAVRVIPTKEGQVGSVAKVSFVAEVAARTVVASPKLNLEMSGPGNAIVGDALTYHFEIENTGSGDASKVFLRNVLPKGLSHPSGDDLEYEVGLLKAGEKKEIDLTLNAAKAGEFSTKALLVGAGGLKTETSAKVKILGDRLTITRTGPKRRYVGRRASYSNTLVNQSERKVQAVRVVESVPAGMEFVKASAGGQFDPNNRTVTWTIAELGPKANQLLQLELLAKAEGPQASQVTAFDPNGSRAVVKSETTVDGYTALRLDVAEYNDPVDVGEQVGLRVVATNRGTRATSNAVVKLTIPEEMEFVSAKGPVDFKRDGQTLTFNPIPSLDARGEMAFDLVLKSAKPGDARLRLEISSDQMAKPLLRDEGIRILAKRP